MWLMWINQVAMLHAMSLQFLIYIQQIKLTYFNDFITAITLDI